MGLIVRPVATTIDKCGHTTYSACISMYNKPSQCAASMIGSRDPMRLQGVLDMVGMEITLYAASSSRTAENAEGLIAVDRHAFNSL